MKKPLVAIVILNFNGKKFLQKFLPSVLASSYENFKIIIADNASADDSVSFLQQNFPAIELILLEKNFGFAEGYNQALARVEADYFVLLNSDVEVTKNWIEPIIQLMESDEKIAFCQPKILSYKDEETFEYAGAAGGWLDVLGYPFARGRVFGVLEKDTNQFPNSMNIFWATGAAMFAKAAVYKQLGGFYAYLFAHQEEVDLCWRAQLAGYKIACCTQSAVYHVGGGTLPQGHFRKTFFNFRNNLIMLSRNLLWREKVWKIPLRLTLDGVFAVKSILLGDFSSFKGVLYAHFAFYKWSFSRHKKQILPKKPMRSLNGVCRKWLIWQHFARGKKYFEDFFQ